MAPLNAHPCAHHADRPGLALCMSCRKVMCQECTATWEGVNYCHPCLTARAAQPRVRSSAIRSIAWGAALLALLAVTGRMMAWSAALLARMF